MRTALSSKNISARRAAIAAFMLGASTMVGSAAFAAETPAAPAGTETTTPEIIIDPEHAAALEALIQKAFRDDENRWSHKYDIKDMVRQDPALAALAIEGLGRLMYNSPTIESWGGYIDMIGDIVGANITDENVTLAYRIIMPAYEEGKKFLDSENPAMHIIGQEIIFATAEHFLGFTNESIEVLAKDVVAISKASDIKDRDRLYSNIREGMNYLADRKENNDKIFDTFSPLMKDNSVLVQQRAALILTNNAYHNEAHAQKTLELIKPLLMNPDAVLKSEYTGTDLVNELLDRVFYLAQAHKSMKTEALATLKEVVETMPPDSERAKNAIDTMVLLTLRTTGLLDSTVDFLNMQREAGTYPYQVAHALGRIAGNYDQYAPDAFTAYKAVPAERRGYALDSMAQLALQNETLLPELLSTFKEAATTDQPDLVKGWVSRDWHGSSLSYWLVEIAGEHPRYAAETVEIMTLALHKIEENTDAYPRFDKDEFETQLEKLHAIHDKYQRNLPPPAAPQPAAPKGPKL